MRAHTNLRSAFRFTMMLAAATGVTFAASQAHADTAGAAAGPNASTGTAVLKFDMAQGLDTSIDTGYLGPSVAQVRAVVKIDPVKDGGPLYTINMPKGAVVNASWAGDKKIVLKPANGSQSDGTITVRHTLTPSLELKVSAFGLSANFAFDADKLVNKLPGAKFAYDSKATQAFAPWGFTKVDTKLSAPDLANSVLFSETFDNLYDIVTGDSLDPDNWAGSIGIRAATKPTFSYKTTKVMLTGSQTPITTIAGESVLDVVDADFMDVTAQVEGEMDVAGTMDIQPFVSMSKVFGYSFGTTIGINAYSQPYTVAPQKVAYKASIVHIPLPNVKAPTAGVDLGAVKPGGSATKTVTIENTGEMAAVVTAQSSDAQFTVPGDSITIAPKSKYEMQIKFAPSNAGAATADISITSNDPDSPVQTFKIGANGADVGGPSSKDDSLPASPTANSGCGCKTAGTTTSTGGWAGIGLLALGITVAARRRKSGNQA